MRAEIRHGNCLDVLAVAARAGERYHAVVTDPPYHLTSIQKRFGKEGSAPAQHGKDGSFARLSRGFMGRTWDGGDVAFRPETWRLVWDVMYPGAHMAVFGGTRTFHRMAVAIEDAGFEPLRDSLFWFYGTGLPKSHDVSKGVDKVLGKTGTFGEPKSAAHAGWIARGALRGDEGHEGYQRPWMDDPEAVRNAARQYIPATEEAAEWAGWGTALKPSYEPILLARKPLAGTVARNVLAYGCGGINVAGCKVIRHDDESSWPTNVLHDGSPEILAKLGKAADLFPALGYTEEDYRFFYSSKANKAERMGSQHPTVKPIALLRWLARLITPPGGRILDPFAGTGTTGAAARAEGFGFTGVEMTDEYVEDCIRRLSEAAVDRGPWGLDLRDTLARNRAAQEALRAALS